MRDPCGDYISVFRATVAGGAAGAFGASISIGGTVLGAIARNVIAGFFGNAAGQIAASGPDQYSFAQSIAQGAVSGAAGAYGNLVGVHSGIIAVRYGARNALSASQNAGTVGAIAAGTISNVAVPAELGGLNRNGKDEGRCGCKK